MLWWVATILLWVQSIRNQQSMFQHTSPLFTLYISIELGLHMISDVRALYWSNWWEALLQAFLRAKIQSLSRTRSQRNTHVSIIHSTWQAPIHPRTLESSIICSQWCRQEGNQRIPKKNVIVIINNVLMSIVEVIKEWFMIVFELLGRVLFALGISYRSLRNSIIYLPSAAVRT